MVLKIDELSRDTISYKILGIYGGSKDDYGKKIIMDKDGYVFVGYTWSNDGDIIDHHGERYSDIWAVKIDFTGNIIWSNCIGGYEYDEKGYDIIKNKDNEYIIVGESWSKDSDVGVNYGKSDLILVKLNAKGNFEKSKVLGGSDEDRGIRITIINDSCYLVIGETKSNDIIYSENILSNVGKYDIWILLLDNNFNILGESTFGGDDEEHPKDFLLDNNRIYIISSTYSYNGVIPNNHGYNDFWLLGLELTINY